VIRWYEEEDVYANVSHCIHLEILISYQNLESDVATCNWFSVERNEIPCIIFLS